MTSSTRGLRITGVIREGSHEVTPAADGDLVHVGDRLIGCYLKSSGAPGRLRLQIHAASSSGSSRSHADDREPSLDALETGGTWELDTTHMRPRRYSLSLRMLDAPLTARERSSTSVEFRLLPRALDANAPHSG